ncbi:MAG: RNA-binding protein [Acidobacteriota bacterium]|nr:RNA-binding protein [Acidobacteriota bacterium]
MRRRGHSSHVCQTLRWKSLVSTTGEELQQLFSQAGTVESATVVEDRDTGRR